MAGEGYQIRTDLALETQERIQKSKKNLRGIGFKEDERKNGIIISTVSIETENASKTMGRPKGKYITIEAPQLSEDDTNYHREVSEEFSMVLRELMLEVGERISLKVKSGEWSILVVGLGNREVTADALGPRVVDNLFITRHILKEYGTYAFGSKIVNKISGIVFKILLIVHFLFLFFLVGFGLSSTLFISFLLCFTIMSVITVEKHLFN